MKRRARLLSDALNKMEGISCTSIDGAMYAFPTITIPPKAVSEAERLGVAADEFYCMKLLEETGIVVVPGSGFGQKEGTFHFRTTVLPQEEDLQLVIQSISDFHHKLLADYA
jgi:aspartate/methionine/tyrosine aminotransferase